MKTTQLTQKTTIAATEESMKEVIADAIREKVSELNKILIQAHKHDLIVLIDVDVDNLDDDDNPIPLFQMDVRIIEEVEY